MDVKRILEEIEADMMQHPESTRPVSQDLLNRARELTDGVEVDLESDQQQTGQGG